MKGERLQPSPSTKGISKLSVITNTVRSLVCNPVANTTKKKSPSPGTPTSQVQTVTEHEKSIDIYKKYADKKPFSFQIDKQTGRKEKLRASANRRKANATNIRRTWNVNKHKKTSECSVQVWVQRERAVSSLHNPPWTVIVDTLLGSGGAFIGSPCRLCTPSYDAVLKRQQPSHHEGVAFDVPR